MDKQTITDYVMHTPNNTNPAILDGMLDQLAASGPSLPDPSTAMNGAALIAKNGQYSWANGDVTQMGSWTIDKTASYDQISKTDPITGEQVTLYKIVSAPNDGSVPYKISLTYANGEVKTYSAHSGFDSWYYNNDDTSGKTYAIGDMFQWAAHIYVPEDILNSCIQLTAFKQASTPEYPITALDGLADSYEAKIVLHSTGSNFSKRNVNQLLPPVSSTAITGDPDTSITVKIGVTATLFYMPCTVDINSIIKINSGSITFVLDNISRYYPYQKDGHLATTFYGTMAYLSDHYVMYFPVAGIYTNGSNTVEIVQPGYYGAKKATYGTVWSPDAFGIQYLESTLSSAYIPQANPDQRGTVYQIPYISDLTSAPTQSDFNNLLAALRKAGIMEATQANMLAMSSLPGTEANIEPAPVAEAASVEPIDNEPVIENSHTDDSQSSN